MKHIIRMILIGFLGLMPTYVFAESEGSSKLYVTNIGESTLKYYRSNTMVGDAPTRAHKKIPPGKTIVMKANSHSGDYTTEGAIKYVVTNSNGTLSFVTINYYNNARQTSCAISINGAPQSKTSTSFCSAVVNNDVDPNGHYMDYIKFYFYLSS